MLQSNTYLTSHQTPHLQNSIYAQSTIGFPQAISLPICNFLPQKKMNFIASNEE